MTADPGLLLITSVCCLALVIVIVYMASTQCINIIVKKGVGKKLTEGFSLFGSSDAARDTKISDLTTKVDANAKSITANSSAIQSLQKTVKNLETMINNVKELSNTASLSEQINNLKQGHDTVSTNIKEIQDKLTLIESKNYSEQIDKLLEADKSIQKTIADLTTSLNTHSGDEHIKLNKSIADLNNKIDEVKKSMDKLPKVDEKGNIKTDGEIEAAGIGSLMMVTQSLNAMNSISSGNITASGTIKGKTLSADNIDENLKKQILNVVYPVGSIYMSFVNKSPADIVGGKWEQIKNRFLYASDSTSGSTGGEASHVLSASEMPSHTHKTKLTLYTEHNSITNAWHEGVTRHNATIGYNGNNDRDNDASFWMWDTSAATGNNAAHNNMPPYVTVYCWRRTA